MKITNAADMQELAELGEAEFEKNVLEGPLLKSIVASIEEAAINGQTSFSKGFDLSDTRSMEVIQNAFLEAGYECEMKIEHDRRLFGIPYSSREIVIIWNKK